MKLPQIIRFADYLKENPAEAVRTVLYQDQHDNMVLWQIPPQTMLPAHRHPHGADIWIVLADDAQSGRIIRAGEAVVVGDRQIHGARNNGKEDCILVSVISPKAGFEKA